MWFAGRHLMSHMSLLINAVIVAVSKPGNVLHVNSVVACMLSLKKNVRIQNLSLLANFVNMVIKIYLSRVETKNFIDSNCILVTGLCSRFVIIVKLLLFFSSSGTLEESTKSKYLERIQLKCVLE